MQRIQEYMIIGAVVAAGMVSRSQFKGDVDGDRLLGEWGFTGDQRITSYVFMWPLISRVLKLNIAAIISWGLHVTPFYIWYFSFNFLSYDPSGHICATLIALVLLRQNCGNHLDWLIFVIVQVNAIISLYYTAYVFHTGIQSLIGYLSAIIICEVCNIVRPYVVKAILNDQFQKV